jgi:hypothetical protein
LWNEYYEELRRYRALHGHCSVPQSYYSLSPTSTRGGSGRSAASVGGSFRALGKWAERQRRMYERHPRTEQERARIARLESIGFEWERGSGISGTAPGETTTSSSSPNQQQVKGGSAAAAAAAADYIDPANVSATDVIMGRTGGGTHHPGNEFYRRLCWESQEEYRRAMRQTKKGVGRKIVNVIRGLRPPGRFLEPVSTTQEGLVLYREIPREHVVEKVCQTVRDQRRPTKCRTLKKAAMLESMGGGGGGGDTAMKRKIVNPSHYDGWAAAQPAVTGNKRLKQQQQQQQEAEEEGPTEGDRAAQKQIALRVLDRRGLTIGTRLDVFWPLDNRYYSGTVTALGSVPAQVSLLYDDDETEWIDLNERDFRLLPAGGGFKDEV